MIARSSSRRQWLQASACAWFAGAIQRTAAQPRPLREMQIHKVPELGLAIWVENQPPWEAELSQTSGHPSFIVQSPDHHHPPVVMTYASWPQERVSDAQLPPVASSAIQRASQNFGLNLAQARTVSRSAAQYGVLSGFEGQFVGRVQGIAMDVRVFVGQTSGRFPVALSIYTLEGKMGHLGEVLRRSWGQLAYLAG
ncbi:hypothetical protein [Rhodoferax ferrireducens]|uniref:hypothetical protein n=1 Tax=Rhodoferax ferrireducens TaxID=192843 RepID=UPI000E0D90F5|nr:hypothetical protein [Rhodoferax ferrireducens]